ISGTGFAAGATVTLGGAAAVNVTVVDENTITATTPAHALGVVDIIVTNSGKPPVALSNGYTYNGAPFLASQPVISPANPLAGRPVTITVVTGDPENDPVT